MWSRVVEVMLGCWLLVSPFVFRHSSSEPRLWIVDFTAGLAVIVCGLLSYMPSLRWAHLLTLLTASALVGFAVVDSAVLVNWGVAGIAAPALQNHVVLGLLLLMLGIIPNHASQPPRFRAEIHQNET